MAKFILKTSTAWAGTEQEHEIDGDFETEEQALEAFGGEDEAWLQVIEDHQPEYWIEEV